ncbi:MAG: cell filamentation protein Fic [Hydrocarboniphaga sp.]|uniref:Fic family protein n=1 Tax=Hydrocarboniphaga sp. TaxID=2033016 RepID=UPI002636FDA4|nr:Fic family protein [Hydrocarboniphaga sp.]MDB5972592.1 cell filamentation protein Fic [Hydrocarboniphaga sp.]
MSKRLGTYVTRTTVGESFRAFIPPDLPPDPPLVFDSAMIGLLEEANRLLGRLDGLAAALPDPQLLLYQYVRKEAVMSSQIEGTQSSLSDLLIHEMDEIPGVPEDDVEEVSCYVRALNFGVQRLASLPLSLRLLREIHAQLLASGRGATKMPGEFRRSQNWLGGSRPGNASFVPPPPENLMDCLGALESFLHDGSTPPLIRAALAHVQFETIHPFLDGNGRLGRLLIALMLVEAKVLQYPLLYLSLHFKSNRSEYYERLSRVRTHGDWEGWLAYFLRGVIHTAGETIDTTRQILALFDRDRARIATVGRLSGTALRLHEHLRARPVTTVALAAASTKVNRTSIVTALAKLTELGIVRELTGNRRNRLFAYDTYLALLSRDTEPLPD